MKINIGTNYFGDNARQSLARETHSIIQKKHNNVKVFNIQFEDSLETFNNDVTIENLHVLKRSSKNILPNYDRKLPFVRDIFDALAKTDCDIFVVINSDILITDNLIMYIEKNNIQTATTCQRLDINNITSLNDQIIGQRFEIAGFDGFIFNKNWYIKNQIIFEDYLLGKVYFDHAYALLIKIFGDNQKILNYSPTHIAHIFHGHGSHVEDPGNLYNKDIYENSFAKKLYYIWDNYVHSTLIQRTPHGRFLDVLKNEDNIELAYFKDMLAKEHEEIQIIKRKLNL
jgi:hypothetical protein